MDKKIIFLIILFLILGGAVLLKFQGETTKKEKKEFLSYETLSKIKTIEIVSGKDKTILKDIDSNWVVENKFNFDADFPKIQRLIDNLKNIKIIHNFETDEQNLNTLELVDPVNKKGRLISLKDKNGKDIIKITAGKVRAKGGQYIKTDKTNDVMLIENELFIDSSSEKWLKKDLIKAKDLKIDKVSLFSDKDKKIFELKNNQETLNIDIAYPQDKTKVVNQDKAKDLFEILSNLDMKDINAEKETDQKFQYKFLFETKDKNKLIIFIHDAAKHLVSIHPESEQLEKSLGLNSKIKNYIFELSKWDFENFILETENLYSQNEK